MNRNAMRQAAAWGEARVARGVLHGARSLGTQRQSELRSTHAADGSCRTHTQLYIRRFLPAHTHTHTYYIYIIKLMKQAALDALGRFGGRSWYERSLHEHPKLNPIPIRNPKCCCHCCCLCCCWGFRLMSFTTASRRQQTKRNNANSPRPDPVLTHKVVSQQQ